jgi:hypothetical protein
MAGSAATADWSIFSTVANWVTPVLVFVQDMLIGAWVVDIRQAIS